MPNLDEHYAAWYWSLRADGTVKNRTLEEWRQRFKPVRLYANSFTIRDVRTGQTHRVRFVTESLSTILRALKEGRMQKVVLLKPRIAIPSK